MSAKSREAEKPTPGCNLQIARMPGLTRLKCEGCGFYAAICDGPTEALTDAAVRAAAANHGDGVQS